MRGAGDRIFRHGHARREETTDKVVFPFVPGGDGHFMLPRRHGGEIRINGFHLLAALQYQHPGAAFSRLDVVADTECGEHLRWRRLCLRRAGREVQRHPVTFTADGQATRSGVKMKA